MALAAPVRAGEPYLVKDINPGPESSFLTWLTRVGDRVFFIATDGVHGQELWVSDGTEQGTYMVMDIVPGPEGSVPQRVTAFGEMVVRGEEMRVHTASALG